MCAHEAETSSPCLSCFTCTRAVSRSYIEATFPANLPLFLTLKALCKLQERSMAKSGWAIFANIYWGPGPGTGMLAYISKNIISHAPPVSSRRSRPRPGQSGSEWTKPETKVECFSSHSLLLLSHGLLFFYTSAALLLLLSSSSELHGMTETY